MSASSPRQSAGGPSQLLHSEALSPVFPLLKWAGSKRSQALRIQALLGPPTGRYIEPFTGSAAAYLGRTDVPPALLTDASPRLMGFHQVVQRSPDDLVAAYRELPLDVAGGYHAVREAFNDCSEHATVRQAARFVWLNRCCFNGLYRETRAGRFNVGPGDATRAPRLDVDHVRAVSARLQQAELAVADFAATMRRARAGDRVYADPPYVALEHRASWTGYTKNGFTVSDHHRLAIAARRAVSRGATVAVSNHLTELTARGLYAAEDGWRLAEMPKVRRRVGGRGADRRSVREVVAVLG